MSQMLSLPSETYRIRSWMTIKCNRAALYKATTIYFLQESHVDQAQLELSKLMRIFFNF